MLVVKIELWPKGAGNKADLSHNSFKLEKEFVEFSVFDTKVSHDAAWILQK